MDRLTEVSPEPPQTIEIAPGLARLSTAVESSYSAELTPRELPPAESRWQAIAGALSLQLQAARAETLAMRAKANALFVFTAAVALWAVVATALLFNRPA